MDSSELPKLKRRLADVGVLAPSRIDDHEAWRACLGELCVRYLGSQEAFPSEGGAAPAPMQLAALRMRVEAQRKRGLDLAWDLDLARQRESKLRRLVSEDPVMRQRSLSDFVRCLEHVRQHLPADAALAEDPTDESNFDDFVRKVTALCEEHGVV
mmetsp:Transcript_31124/g.58382  ORF Transcript_31124/g.58382 Transcript_31124/m.58382 type:complete len:155 (-) Transcript_31124:151-615(-)